MEKDQSSQKLRKDRKKLKEVERSLWEKDWRTKVGGRTFRPDEVHVLPKRPPGTLCERDGPCVSQTLRLKRAQELLHIAAHIAKAEIFLGQKIHRAAKFQEQSRAKLRAAQEAKVTAEDTDCEESVRTLHKDTPLGHSVRTS